MIKLLTGIPGSGKSYRAVHDFMKIKDEYYLFHNIDGLQAEKIDDGKYIQDFTKLDMPFNNFFTLENQKKLCADVNEKYGRKVLIIIDEAQVFMARLNESVREWISYHRHLGQDVWIITQNKFNIAKEYGNLVEIEIQGKRGFVFQSFIYSYFDHGERVKTDKLKKDQKIFDLYKSFHIKEKDKPKSNLFKFMLVMGIIAVISGTYFIFFVFPKQFKEVDKKYGQAVDMKSEKKSSARHKETEINYQEDKPVYQFVGFVKNRLIMTDQSGNLFYRDTLYEGNEETVTDRDKFKGYALHPTEGPKKYNLVAVRNSAESAGRARAGAPSHGNLINQGFKKVVVRID